MALDTEPIDQSFRFLSPLEEFADFVDVYRRFFVMANDEDLEPEMFVYLNDDFF